MTISGIRPRMNRMVGFGYPLLNYTLLIMRSSSHISKVGYEKRTGTVSQYSSENLAQV
jgi:hypothetical protein